MAPHDKESSPQGTAPASDAPSDAPSWRGHRRRHDPTSLSGGRIAPDPRRLRLYLAVLEHGSTHRASAQLHLSQSSFTRAVQDLEREAGVPLCERTSRGMAATPYGAILAERARRALSYLAAAEQEIRDARGGRAEPYARGLAERVTQRQLAALIAIADHHTETDAALHLSVRQPTITIALHDLERLVGEKLFERTPRGMLPTLSGELLLRRARLAFAEIAAAGDDIASRLGRITGRVVVGELPLSGAQLAPRAIDQLLRAHPGLQITVVHGTLRSLIHEMRCGNVDVVIGALVNLAAARDIEREHLFDDSLVIVVRPQHPLAARRRMELGDLARADWVVPRRGTPARSALDQVMHAAGVDIGPNPIECNGLLTVKALLADSDRLAVVSRDQIRSTDGLRMLPVDLGIQVSVGAGRRADGLPSAGVQMFLEYLRRVGAELQAGAPLKPGPESSRLR